MLDITLYNLHIFLILYNLHTSLWTLHNFAQIVLRIQDLTATLWDACIGSASRLIGLLLNRLHKAAVVLFKVISCVLDDTKCNEVCIRRSIQLFKANYFCDCAFVCVFIAQMTESYTYLWKEMKEICGIYVAVKDLKYHSNMFSLLPFVGKTLTPALYIFINKLQQGKRVLNKAADSRLIKRQARFIPELIYSIEQFEVALIQVYKKGTTE